MDQDLLQMLDAVVMIAKRQGHNSHGEAQYGQLVSYPAHITYKTQMVYDTLGQQLVSSAQVYLDGSVSVDPTCRIVLPNPDEPTGFSYEPAHAPRILHIESHCSDTGPESYYKKVFV